MTGGRQERGPRGGLRTADSRPPVSTATAPTWSAPCALAAGGSVCQMMGMYRWLDHRWRVVAIVFVLTCAAAADADDRERSVRKNPFVKDQYDVYENGRRTGTVRANPFAKGQLDVRDEHGRTRETVRPNPFVTDQYDVYRDGRRAGTIRPDPFVPDRYDLRDDRGRPQGTIRQNPFVRDQWDVETRE